MPMFRRWLLSIALLLGLLAPAAATLTTTNLAGFNAYTAAVAGGNIEFVGGSITGKLGATSGTSTIALNSGLTGGIDSAVSDGDLVLAFFATSSGANRTLDIDDGTTDYTLIGSELWANDNYDTNLRVAYKFVNGDTSTRFGPTGNADDGGVMAVYVFRGVDPTTPLDVAAVGVTGTNSLLANPGSITPVTAGAFIVAAGAGGHGQAATKVYSSSDLTDTFSLTQFDNYNPSLLVGQKDDWSSGAFDPAAFTFSGSDGTNYSWCAMTIALRPE